MKYRLPLAYRSKLPFGKGDWHKRISDNPKEWARWIAQGLNIGVPLEECGLSVADFDGTENHDGTTKVSGKVYAREFYEQHKELCKALSVTRRGVHVIFCGTTKTRPMMRDGEKIGDIKGNGYIVIAPSIVFDKESGETWKYTLINDGEPPPFPEHLFLDEQKEKTRIVRGVIRDIRKYLARIESIKHQGRGWAAGLVRAASCCRDSGLSEAQAMVALIEWNNGPTVFPKHELNELARAVSNVYAKGGRACGPMTHTPEPQVKRMA